MGLCNDDSIGPDSADRGSGIHIRDTENPRRRVALVVFNISELDGLPIQKDVTLSNMDDQTGSVDVYGIIEDTDDGIDEATIT